jgi:peptidyl-tRNA hydrolase, PTH2 family
MSDARETKQVIVIRRDLKMRRGKEIAQGGHAAMAWLVSRMNIGDGTTGQGKVVPNMATAFLTDAQREWIEGAAAKIVCQVRGEAELLMLWRQACDAELVAHLILDRGRTEFHLEATYTAVVIGPDWADKIDAVTGGLVLY